MARFQIGTSFLEDSEQILTFLTGLKSLLLGIEEQYDSPLACIACCMTPDLKTVFSG